MFGIFSKFKNYIMIGMLIVIVALAGMYFWQRITVVKQKGEITQLTTENISLKEKEKINKKNIEDAKVLTIKYQILQNETSKIKSELIKLERGKKCLGEEDEKLFTIITNRFNDRRMQSEDGDNSTE